MRKSKPVKVFFNASVVLAGLKSPFGGSAKLLNWCKDKKIQGIISEIIIDEIIRNISKIGLSREVTADLGSLFDIKIAPQKEKVEYFKGIVTDFGDAHVLASCTEENVEFLVTLDKKHLLVLKNKVKIFKIVSPGELIEMYNLQNKK